MYQALYGYTSPLGAYQALYGAATGPAVKDYKKLVHLMKKRNRIAHKLHSGHSESASKKSKMKNELKMLTKHIKHLKTKLGALGDKAEQEAASSSGGTITTSGSRASSSGHVNRGAHPGLRRHGHGHLQQRPPQRKHAGAYAARPGELDHDGDGIMNRDEGHSYPGQHRARLPGQRGADGRRRQGPISANEMQSTDVSQDTSDDSMDMYDTGENTVEEALAGVMDFVGDVFHDKTKMLYAAGIGLGVYFLVYSNNRKR